MASTLSETMIVDGTTLPLCIERKRVKHVNARLRGSTLYISAPPQMPSKRVEEISKELASRLSGRERSRQMSNAEDALALVPIPVVPIAQTLRSS